jgi:alcohol dehydrogenase
MSNLEQFKFFGSKVLMQGMRLASIVVPIRDPKLMVGADSSALLGDVIAEHALKKVLIVTSAGIVKRGQLSGLISTLEKNSISSVIYNDILPDPVFSNVTQGLDLYRKEGCDSIVAFGGGSSMDAAKIMAIAAANDCAPEKLVGFFKGWKKPVPFFAVPTTAGTGSESTIASVVSDDDTHEKFFVVDSRTIPLAVTLDPVLMLSVPPALTAATGMDALTHAIEAYIGTIATSETDKKALEAVLLIFENLPKAFTDGSDLAAREGMSLASYKAGQAFTKASLGYVHAISHQLGAHYGLAHGLGNAIVLPYVLEFSKVAARHKLSKLALALNLGSHDDSEAVLAEKMVDAVSKLNTQLDIPKQAVDLKESDILTIAKKAQKEALLNYPAPRHMTILECQKLLRELMPA